MAKEVCEFQKKNYLKNNNRPKFHFSSPVGWINDPNGFSEYKGEYHLFYQYHPYSLNWGPMNWGHSKTKDFIIWEVMDPVLVPTEKYEKFGCFSGTAIQDGEKHILMYTGVEKENETSELQTQCVAIGDGTEYKKLKENPVITANMLPNGSSEVDFRDPKIWKDGDLYYSLVANRSSDGSGQLPLFCSKDLKSWEFLHIVDKSENKIGEMWECPDIFRLDGKGVILLSPQEMEATEEGIHAGSNTIYLLGELDEGYNFKREYENVIDYGLDFYAPQSLTTSDGRQVMIGWLQSWDNHILHKDCNWSGIMSIPRELSIKNNRLYQLPIKEIENHYKNTYSHNGVLCGENIELPNMKGRYLDLTVEAEVDDNSYFDIILASDDKHYSKINYNGIIKKLETDRTYCGIKNDFISTRKINIEPIENKIKLRILLDRYSVEVFANDGEKVLSMLISTNEEAKGLKFNFNQDTKVEIICNKL